ncbi:RNA-directed DNA polymerase [Acinetobacter sp. ANC 3781]|uniref:retron Ec67 family RNA-directed DNA polymerase/endonuclease n=1 Tax=Acinetobacter sp. ANC 3781 TaxID=2529835 RepID=UPI00103BA9C5|nr:retron Ec67 family RNA-directed DNA polymerase/endonuclease [Acinetobacter sp. ANC 3781]TCB75549.1 RNA-directed DNA polymerase [Acinetobacter sp. ANC 3781]
MTNLENLKRCETARDLAILLDIPYKRFSIILYRGHISSKYSTFEIKKKDQTSRKISAPYEYLKIVQKKLSVLLEQCLSEIENNRLAETLSKFQENRPNKYPKFHLVSHGFRKKIYIDSPYNFHSITPGIFTNAHIHTNKNLVLNIDIKDFFTSIKFNRLVGFFIQNKYFELSEEVALTIARIATFRENDKVIGYLPQGSPCSPVISNLFTAMLDSRLVKLCKKNKCVYTRYADDITISTNLKEFPEAILTMDENLIVLNERLIRQFETFGFHINNKKTRLANRKQRQVVTGLVVNKKVNINRHYYKATRAMVDSFCKTNTFVKSKYHVFHEPQIEDSQSLNGILNYIYNIKKVEPYKLLEQHDDYLKHHNEFIDKKNWESRLLYHHINTLNGLDKMYGSFIFHKKYVYNDKPSIICEGITDVIHFKKAAEKLGITNIKFSSFNSDYQFEKLLHLDGGTENLKKFLSNLKILYKSEVQLNLLNPTIIIVDRDGAGKGVITEAKKLFKNSWKEHSSTTVPTMKFLALFKKFYIFELPVVPFDPEKTVIEFLYNNSTLLNETMMINGKHLICEAIASKDQIDKKKVYSKISFIKNIIPKHESSLDYTYFKQVFDVIEEISTLMKTI